MYRILSANIHPKLPLSPQLVAQDLNRSLIHPRCLHLPPSRHLPILFRTNPKDINHILIVCVSRIPCPSPTITTTITLTNISYLYFFMTD